MNVITKPAKFAKAKSGLDKIPYPPLGYTVYSHYRNMNKSISFKLQASGLEQWRLPVAAQLRGKGSNNSGTGEQACETNRRQKVELVIKTVRSLLRHTKDDLEK